VGSTRRGAFAILLGLAALDAAGYSVIAPVAPAIAERTDVGPFAIGALVGVFAAGQALGFWAGGAVVARRGARPAILLSLALIAVGCLGFVLLDGLGAWFPARALMGLGSGGLWIAIVLATIGRFRGDEYRRLTSILGAYAVGAVAGPAFGALEGVRAPFAAFLALTVAGLALAAGLSPPREPAVVRSDRAAMRSGGFAFASIGILAIAIGYGIVEGPLTLHLGERLGQGELASLYVAAAVVTGAAAVAAGSLAPRPLVGVGAVLLAAGIGLAGATSGLLLWLPALALVALAIGLGEAGALGVLLDAVGTERIVTALVVWSQVWSLGYLAGPVLGGLAAEVAGYAALGVVPTVAALAVLAASRRSNAGSSPSESRSSS
jgi:predicted MFS family arabinose efflux permease